MVQGKTTMIRAESKVTIKLRDNFYSVTYTEERSIPTDVEVNLDEERTALFDEVNAVVDSQAAEIVKTFSR